MVQHATVQNGRPEFQPAHQDTQKPSSAGGKVVVCCNLPNGLLIHADRMIESSEPVMGGGTRAVRIAERGPEIKINGNPTMGPTSPRPSWPVINGYGITRGVDQETWERWLASNRTSPMVVNRCVFALPTASAAKDAAKDHKGIRTGLEPFAPEGDPRAPKRGKNLSEVKPDEDADI